MPYVIEYTPSTAEMEYEEATKYYHMKFVKVSYKSKLTLEVSYKSKLTLEVSYKSPIATEAKVYKTVKGANAIVKRLYDDYAFEGEYKVVKVD